MNPYPECESCKDLGDCHHPDVAQDLLGSAMPPDNCPRPLKVMELTLKKRKKNGFPRTLPPLS